MPRFGLQAIIDAQHDDPRVSLVLREHSLAIRTATSYSFASHFLTPTDGWSFTLPVEQLEPLSELPPSVVAHINPEGRKQDEQVNEALRPGARVSLYVDASVQGDGYIDSVSYAGSRSSGSLVTISGRDRLGQAVDANADPTVKFKEAMTLEQVLRALFEPFGITQFEIDNDANRAIMTGLTRGDKTSKKGKPLKSFKMHQLQPRPHEGVFEFASRVSQRHGLWLWLSADGETLICSKPRFDQEPQHQIVRTKTGKGNVLSGTVTFDATEQPTLIVADGFGGGGEFGHSRLRAIMANPAFYTSDIAFQKPFASYRDAVRINDVIPLKTPMPLPANRTMYLHDDQSKTIEQLQNFVKREMALRVRKSLQVHYEVPGHGQFIGDTFVPWTVDTVVDVFDELAKLHEPMYVLARTFTYSRQAGTRTTLELVRLGSLQF